MGIYLLRYFHIGIHLLPFFGKIIKNFEINFRLKEGHSKVTP